MTSGPRETSAAALQRLRQHFVDNLTGSMAVLEGLSDRVDAEPGAAEAITELGKQLHRLRGTAGTFGFAAAAELAQELETELEEWRMGPQPGNGRRSARVRRFIADFYGACGATSPPRARSRDPGAR